MDTMIVKENDMQLEEFLQNLKDKYKVNKKIMFINPPQFSLKRFNMDIAKNRGYYAYPPTGIMFLISSIDSLGFEIEVLDLNFKMLDRAIEENYYDENMWKHMIDERLSEFKPSFIALSTMFSNIEEDYNEMLNYLMGYDRHVVMVGGTYASFEYNKLLMNDLCHVAFTRDCENKLPYFLSKLLDIEINIEATSGIFYKYNNEIKETLGSNEFPQIDIDITKSYNYINIEDYCKVGSLNQFSRIIGKDKPYAVMSMNRGCRGNCTFCSVRSLLGKYIRSRSVETILNEIRYLNKFKQINSFDWLDDDLLANRGLCLELFQRMIDEEINIKWYANNGLIATFIDDKMLDLMVRSGCIGFKIGIESGNSEMLKEIRKPATLEKLFDLSKRLEKFPQLLVAGNYIIGFPNEKFYQMLDTFKFANEIKIDWAGYYICQPLKGAEAFHSFEMLGDNRCNDKIDNYIPTREFDKKFEIEEEVIYKGLDVFRLDLEKTVSNEQLSEVWFAFGFITNFINNKNLLNKCTVSKFIDWVEAAIEAYPYDAGMTLFLYIAYLVNDDREKALDYLKKTRTICAQSSYWINRFTQFELLELIQKENISKEYVYLYVNNLRNSIRDKIYRYTGNQMS
ncbi:MAG: B12-binding domain-containing radical SAM protein [Bacillota bacterium]